MQPGSAPTFCPSHHARSPLHGSRMPSQKRLYDPAGARANQPRKQPRTQTNKQTLQPTTKQTSKQTSKNLGFVTSRPGSPRREVLGLGAVGLRGKAHQACDAQPQSWLTRWRAARLSLRLPVCFVVLKETERKSAVWRSPKHDTPMWRFLKMGTPCWWDQRNKPF